MFLPPANEVAGRSCFQWYVHRSVQRGRGAGGSHVTITHDVLDITIQGPSCIGPWPQPPVQGQSGSLGTGTHQTCSTWTSLYMFNSDFTVQGLLSPLQCSTLFIMKHVRSASGWLASHWNAFLLFIVSPAECINC